MSALRHFRPRSGGLPIDRRLLHPGACRKSIMGMTRVELLRSEGGTLHRGSKIYHRCEPDLNIWINSVECLNGR